MKKKWLWISISVVFIILLISIKKCNGDDTSLKVVVEKAAERTIIETVSASGKIQPEVEVKLSSEVSGEVVELPIKEGQHVEKGDLLVKINANIYSSQLEAITASLNSAKANMSNSKARLLQVQAQFANTDASYMRNKKLFDQGAISESEFQSSKAAYEGGKADVEAAKQTVAAAEFNVDNAEAALKEANSKLEKTSIYAPVSGTISKLTVEKGERVVGTSQMAGTELLRIANLNEMEASVDVNENDIVRVHLNDTALIEVDAYLGRTFKGIVTSIANSANVTGLSSDQVTNFTVKIRMLQTSYKDLMLGADKSMAPFRPGMSASVDIQTKRVVNVVTVPIQAVTTRSDSSKNEMKHSNMNEDEDEVVVVDEKEKKEEKEKKIIECIFINDKGVAKLIPVTTGIQNNDYIEIISGLKAGDELITAPYSAISKLLKNKKKIKVVDKADLFTDKK